MFKFLLLLLLPFLLLPTTPLISTDWNLRCFLHTSRVKDTPRQSGPYFKYCAIEYFEKNKELVALGYNYMIGTEDEEIDNAFADNKLAVVVLVQKKKSPGAAESRLYVCRTPLCNVPFSEDRFLEYNEYVKLKKPEEKVLIWGDEGTDFLIFKNDVIVMKNESHAPVITD